MANKKSNQSSEFSELMRTMIIIQLGLAGIPQRSMRVIAGCDIHRVNRILKHLKPKGKKE
jgi:hypothetical protein